MAAFAGYDMPIQYQDGILAEHAHVRTRAGLFDVSHMGQCVLDSPGAAQRLEMLVPGDIQGLAVGRMRYSVFLTPEGGVLDDLMILRKSETRFFLIVNASRKETDFALLQERVGDMEILEDHALLALQGPEAARVLAQLQPAIDHLPFMGGMVTTIRDMRLVVTRSGYTGEDGFEISVPSAQANELADILMQDAAVKWIGLGARDTLRLEASLCLYGHELDETTSPVEAGLSWVIGKRRREAGDFPGAKRILQELKDGPLRRRVGIRPEGRTIAREGAEIYDASGNRIGFVTSGGFSPSLGGPIAMGYISTNDTRLQLMVRGQALPASVVPLPFVPHRYRK